MKYDYFVAGRYRNKENVLRLVNGIKEKGKKPYSFVETDASIAHVGAVDADGEEAMATFEAIEDWWNDAAVREIFETDMQAERDSENFVLLLPAGKSGHLEAGAAYGMGKKCIVIGEQKETETLYLIFDEHYDTIENFLDTL